MRRNPWPFAILLCGLLTGDAAVQAQEAETIALLPGGLDAWKGPKGQWEFVPDVALNPTNPKRLVEAGADGDGPANVLYNKPFGRAGNLVTNAQFGDVDIHLEFDVPEGSNSGIKLQGHYEIQIADSYGKKEPSASECGGIYPRAELLPVYRHIDDGYPPSQNASKPPGEWQTLDIRFRAPRFDADGTKIKDAVFERVALNGKVIHENQSVPTPTGHAWHNREVPLGPILLQGDHGPVAFRNIRVTPLGETAGSEPVEEMPAKDVPGANPELNATFEDPDVSAFVDRFEDESREVAAHRAEIVAILGLEPGMAVADVGAGTGLYTIAFAEAVGADGKVYAVDVAPKFLEFIEERAEKLSLSQVETVFASQESTNLAADSIDLAYLCDVYHHLETPKATLASIKRALRPGGRLVLVEFDREHGRRKDFLREHVRANKETFVSEIEAAGFEAIELDDQPELTDNFIAAFRKPGSQP